MKFVDAISEDQFEIGGKAELSEAGFEEDDFLQDKKTNAEKIMKETVRMHFMRCYFTATK